MGEQSGGNILLGLIPGFGQGFQQAREAKKKDAYLSAQTDLIKQEAKVKEKALIMESMKSDIFGKMTPEQQMASLFPKADDSLESKLKTIMDFAAKQGGGQSPVPLPDYVPGSGTGPTRPGAMSLPEMIAQGQGGGSFFGLTKDDLIRGVLKKELGAEAPMYRRTAPVIMPDGNPGTAPMNDMGLIDMSKAVPSPFRLDTQPGVGPGMAPTQTPVNPYNRKPVGAPVQIGPPPTMEVDAVTPGGGAAKRVLPKFPGSSPAGTGVAGGGGVRTKLDTQDIPIDESTARMYRMKDGSMPPVGSTPREIMSKGGKVVSAKMLDIEGPTKVVTELVDQLEEYSLGEGGIFTGIKPGMFNRGAQGVKDKFSSFVQSTGRGERIALYEGYKQAFAGSLARTVMFEVGVMTDQDIARAVKAVPVILPIPDTEVVAKAKLKLIRGFIGKLSSVTDRKGMEAALVALESSVKAAEKGKPPALGKKNDAPGISSEDALAELRRRKVIP